MIVALDFETYYSAEYSLSRMREVDYLRDDRYETIMCAVKVGDAPSRVFVGHDAIAERLSAIDWTQAALLNHNARFDGSILAWHFGHVPKLYLDTLSMARAMTHATIGRSSLAAVADYLGLGQKGTEVVQARGKRLKDFTPDELEAYAGYCAKDNELCRAVFDTFMNVFPKKELLLIDIVMRMFIEPQAKLDTRRLSAHRTVVRVAKAAVMARVAHIPGDVFSSNTKFAALLLSYGVEVPMKISAITGMEMPALAKADREFKDLCADDDQPIEVQAILAARINAKSTIEETRTDALLALSLREWGDLGPSWMPVPLRYYGAHTGRLSGDGGYNFQNLRRGSALRRAIMAPPGMRVVHRDASQIEARMLAWLAGCTALVGAFRMGRDVYSEFASEVYGRVVTKRDTLERFVGKTSILGLGYQTGAEKLRHTLYIGNGGISVTVATEEAARIVRHYRSTYREIPALWKRGDDVLVGMCQSALNHVYPVVTVSDDALWLPNGMPIPYPELRRERRLMPDGKQMPGFVYKGPYKDKSIYGGKLTENVTQALARIVVTDAAIRIMAETGYHPAMTTHDSLDYVVPEGEAQWWDDYLERQFAVVPSWAAGLPLASEGGWGVTLADAEKGVNR